MSKHTPGPWAMINRKVVTAEGVGVASPLVEALQGVLRVADRATVEFDVASAAIDKATGEKQ